MKEIQGNHANCVVIAVYGNRAYDDGLIQLKDTAELCGFNVIASVAAVAEHSIMRQFSSGRPDEEDSKELKKFAEEILEKLSSDKELSTDYFVPGSHEYKRLGNLSVVPKANASCTGCGKCADACPTGAINKNNTFHKHGVYVCTEGPRFESAAEIKMFAMMGGDLVGMTNMPESILAREAEMCYTNCSIVTNMAAGISPTPLSHKEVCDAMALSIKNMEKLILSFIAYEEPTEAKCNCHHAMQEFGGFKL